MGEVFTESWRYPKVQWIGPNKWRGIEPYTYVTDSGIPIYVPIGDETDGMSSPSMLWSILSPSGKYFPGGKIHDHLYATRKEHGMPREWCDQVLYELCIKLDEDDDIIAAAIYQLVRAGGWRHWE